MIFPLKPINNRENGRRQALPSKKLFYSSSMVSNQSTANFGMDNELSFAQSNREVPTALSLMVDSMASMIDRAKQDIESVDQRARTDLLTIDQRARKDVARLDKKAREDHEKLRISRLNLEKK